MITEQQRLQRKNGIGGSDAAAVIGWSKFKTPYDVWKSKITNEETPVNQAMQIGNDLEAYVREMYEKETNNKVKTLEDTLKHKKHKYILGNLDGLVDDKTGLEIKTTSNAAMLNLKDLTENRDWLCQVAHYAEVAELSTMHVFVYHIESKLTKMYIYNASDTFQNALIKKEVQFWENHVIPSIPPAFTKLCDIKNHFKHAENIQAIADNETHSKIKRLIELHKYKKRLEEEEEKIKTDVYLQMGTANELVNEEGVKLATWNEVSNNRFDVYNFKKHHPELYEQFFITGKTRRFMPNYKLGE